MRKSNLDNIDSLLLCLLNTFLSSSACLPQERLCIKQHCEQKVNTFNIFLLLQVEVRKAPHRPEARRALAVLDTSKVHFEYS